MWNPGAPGAVNGVLQPIGGSETTPAECGSATQDDFCAITNPADGTPAPWTYLNKNGQTSFGEAEFYEGGINLSSTVFPPDSRPSASQLRGGDPRLVVGVRDALKDFVLDQFAPCNAEINTVPSSTSIVLGQSLTDTSDGDREGRRQRTRQET